MKIPISDILVHMRNKVVQKKTAHRPTMESLIFKVVAWIFAKGRNLAFVQFFSKIAGRLFRKRSHFGPLPWPASGWSNARDLPVPPKQTFRDWWKEREEAAK